MHIDLSGPAGRLEAMLDVPGVMPRAAAVVAHPHPGYGGTMRSRVVHEVARALTRAGCAALRFNFRGVGLSAGTFGEGEAERDDFVAALDVVHDRYPDVPLWALGYSFGAWVAVEAAAADSRVRVVVAIAPPLGHYDFSRFGDVQAARYLVLAERDELCPLKEGRRFYGQLEEPRELVVIDAADHAFDGKVAELGDAIEELLGDYGDRLL